MNNCSLKVIRSIEDMTDYYIVFDGVNVGNLDVTEKEDEVFIKHIGIANEYRRCGYARKVVEYMFYLFKKDISFCIATHSESAVKFWNKIIEEKNGIHIRGNIYKLPYKKNEKI